MLLTISTTHKPATDLGYLLHKHPDKFQTVELSIGKATVGSDIVCTIYFTTFDIHGLVEKKK